MKGVLPRAGGHKQAELTPLRVAGCDHEFAEVVSHVRRWARSSASVPV